MVATRASRARQKCLAACTDAYRLTMRQHLRLTNVLCRRPHSPSVRCTPPSCSLGFPVPPSALPHVHLLLPGHWTPAQQPPQQQCETQTLHMQQATKRQQITAQALSSLRGVLRSAGLLVAQCCMALWRWKAQLICAAVGPGCIPPIQGGKGNNCKFQRKCQCDHALLPLATCGLTLSLGFGQDQATSHQT